METKVSDKETSGEAEPDPTLAILPLEQLRVSSAQSTGGQNAEGPSSAVGSRSNVYPHSPSVARQEPEAAGEPRHSELTSRYLLPFHGGSLPW